MKNKITIGDLSKRTGVSRRSIRYYESIGLIKPFEISDANYRFYTDDEVSRLQHILILRSIGLSLGEVSKIIEADDASKVIEIYKNYQAHLEYEISKLEKYGKVVDAVRKVYEASDDQFIDDYRVVKEIVSMNANFGSVFNGLDLMLQIKIIKEIYRTGSLSADTLREMGGESGQAILNEIHMIVISTLINKTKPEVERDIMNHLMSEDKELFEDIANSLFTFEDFSILPDETIRLWVNRFGVEDVFKVINDCSDHLRNKIFRVMNEEEVQCVKEQLGRAEELDLGIKLKTMKRAVEVLKNMEMCGEINIDRY